MPRKIIGLLIVLVGLGSFVFFATILFSGDEEAVEVVEVDDLQEVVKEVEVSDGSEKKLQQKVKKVVVAEVEADVILKERSFNHVEIERLAGVFIERYNSYSSQANYANLYDSMMYMSEGMKVRVAREIQASEKKGGIDSSSYKGVGTKAVAKKLINYNDGDIRARVLIGIIQTEIEADGTEVRNNRNVEVHLLRDANEWKVDNVVWQ